MAFNIYEKVTNRIIAQLENGVIPWRKPWKGSYPINYVSRKQYHGVNLLLLPFGGEYLTFKQAKEAGGNVKKGEKSHMIVFFKMLEREDKDGNKECIPFLQYSNVFHISQCEGIKSKLAAVTVDNDVAPIETAETILNGYIKRSGVTLNLINGSNQAFYSPNTDAITLPIIGQFENAEAYYSTAFHEAAHSTGHASRLDRISKNAAFGNGEYSKEELVAEISAATIMSFAGIELPHTFDNSVAYIQSWIKKLREDVKAIVTASSKAQKATDMILNVASD
jgi:antirestriction protein ArdC